jgi:hypothetical protein
MISPKMTTSQLNVVAQATSETLFIPNTPQTIDNVQHHIGITINQPLSHTPREPNTRYKNLT